MVFAGWGLKNKNCSFEDAKLQPMELRIFARRIVQAQGNECPKGQEIMEVFFNARDGEELRQRFVTAMVE